MSKKKFRVSFIAVLVMIIMAISAPAMQMHAAPKTMSDGGVFDAAYYAQQNPDVVSVLGTDENALYLHYRIYGKKEGRLPVRPASAGLKTIPGSDSTWDDEIIAETNRIRTDAGLKPLKKNARLMGDAAVRAQEQTVIFSHTRPDGRPWYTLDQDKMYGENLIWTADASPKNAVSLWMHSPKHREVILDPGFTEIGVGHVAAGSILYGAQEFY